MRRPGLVDPGAVGDQPAADHRFGETRTLFARRRGGEVSQPGESLQLLGKGAGRADRRDVEVLERQSLAADGKPAGEQGVAARSFAAHMVARDGDELERLLGRPQPGQKRAAGKLADDGTLGRRTVVAHELPLSALMLPA